MKIGGKLYHNKLKERKKEENNNVSKEIDTVHENGWIIRSKGC